ncbi:MAG: hypothetical protein GY822_02365 [Deltaproteobacteria bacterium]|nr:hypothetical protein [Deltaproteobacteria bacterium]
MRTFLGSRTKLVFSGEDDTDGEEVLSESIRIGVGIEAPACVPMVEVDVERFNGSFVVELAIRLADMSKLADATLHFRLQHELLLQ